MRSLKQLVVGPFTRLNTWWTNLTQWWGPRYWCFYLWVMDGPVGRYLVRITEPRLRKYIAHGEQHPHVAFVRGVKQFSMLHEELLLLLHHLVAVARGGVLEIGTYVGGSTVVIAHAVSIHHRPPSVSIEPGGQSNHDLIPSDDIFGDLQLNLARYQLQRHVRLFQGFSSTPEILAEVKALFGPRGIGLLVIDADGNVERDIALYADLLRDDAVLVLDDYQSTYAEEKSTLIKRWVDDAVARGDVISLGIWGWGTWVGLYRRRRS